MQNLDIPNIYNEIIDLNFDNYLTMNYGMYQKAIQEIKNYHV